jgi:hypothetical protein
MKGLTGCAATWSLLIVAVSLALALALGAGAMLLSAFNQTLLIVLALVLLVVGLVAGVAVGYLGAHNAMRAGARSGLQQVQPGRAAPYQQVPYPAYLLPPGAVVRQPQV